MTNEEAIEFITLARDFWKCDDEAVRTNLYQEFLDAYDAAIKALELCSKKKPDKYYDGYYDGFPAWEYKCPNCGREVDDTDHHCECGQAIDWSEVEE